ncbi:hypothetical protein [Albidovulum sp.]
MTNRIAAALAALILIGLVADLFWFDLAGTLFLARKFADLVEYLAFWR